MSLLPHLIIDTNAVCHNYNLCKQFVHSAQAGAVVKNNGYGLGAVQIAKALYEKENCRIFFVAYANEGQEIRAVLPNATIYLLNGFSSDDADIIKKYNLIPVLSSIEQMKKWNDCKITEIRPAIQVETGLNRLGLTYEQIEQIPQVVRDNVSLVLSHLARADEPFENLNQMQCMRLNQMKKFFKNALFSLSASDGIGLGADFHFDVVRVGAFMYGLPVCPALKDKQKTVMDAYVKILQIKDLKKGDAVGYNSTFVAQRPCKVAALGIGYGDGFFRNLSNKGRVFLKCDGKTYIAPIIGRISMDITMCDVSNIPLGALDTQKAYLFSETYGLNEMGKDAGTIGYEVLSALGRGERWIREII